MVRERPVPLLAAVIIAIAFSGCAAIPESGASKSRGDYEGFASEERTGPSRAEGPADERVHEAAPAETGTEEAYDVVFLDVEDSRLKDLLERSSQLISLRDRPPLTEAGLARRIEADVERFDAVLRSEGYYASKVTYAIDRTTSPVRVEITVKPGPAYRLVAYVVQFVDATADQVPKKPAPQELGLKLGQRARAPEIVAAEERLIRLLANDAYPLAKIVDREVTVNHATETVRVLVMVDPGPFARFGPVTVSGLQSVEDNYVRLLIPWRQGDPYEQDKVDAYRTRLMRSTLFAVVTTTHAESLDAEGELPLTVRLVEAKHRSVGGGAKYWTSEGPAVDVFWEHRNLLGRNEDLKLTAEAGRITQLLEGEFAIPDFMEPRQRLFFVATATHTNSTAYNELSVEAESGIRKPLSESWAGVLATSLEWASLKDQKGTRTATLVGLPVTLIYDGTDSRLNPTKGTRLRFETIPYAGWFDMIRSFLVSDVGGSAYLPLDEDRRFVLAGRAKTGSIIGPSRADIPANKRFYAGGGDSVRGYKFQKVGPLNGDNDPLGGRSLVEVGAEVRTRVWGNFGLVPFVDGGTVFEEVYPDFSQPVRWAAGIGLRYFTALGPVRLDVAFPLNPRQDIDAPYQFYISLGQAF